MAKKALQATDFQHLLEEILNNGTAGNAHVLNEQLHPSDIADLLEALPREKRAELWDRVDNAGQGEILTEVHGDVRSQLIEASSDAQLLAALASLQGDELADLHEDLPQNVIKEMLVTMDSGRRLCYETIRSYPDDTAGGLMDIDAITIRAETTLELVLRKIRELRELNGSLPEHFDSVMVVDSNDCPLGALRLADAVSMPPNTLASAVMDVDVPAIPVLTPANEVAQLFENLDLVSAPVVNDKGQLLGRITVDDVIDVIREQSVHAMMSQAGLDEDTDMFAPIWRSALQRTLWLSANLVNAFIAAFVIDRFSASIQQIVALAVLMPVVASMGGVAGNQTLALVTRGIALNQVTSANARHLLLRELGLGIINGLFWAVVIAIVVMLWFSNAQLGLVFGVALTINMLTAAGAGTGVPLLLDRVGVDPALAGGVVLMAITDVVGFTLFLGLATLFLL